MAVEYLKYKGEDLPVQVGYYALKHMQKHTKGKSVSDLQEDLSLYEVLLYYALKIGAIEEGIEFKWKMEDMEFICEHCLFDQFIPIVGGAFTDGTDEDESGKKKEVGSGSKKKSSEKTQ